MAGHEMIHAADALSTTATAIKVQIRLLQVEIASLETLMAQHQAEFRATLERERAERLMAELLRFTADLMPARDAAARLEGELGALRALRASRTVVVADADKRHAEMRPGLSRQFGPPNWLARTGRAIKWNASFDLSNLAPASALERSARGQRNGMLACNLQLVMRRCRP